MKIVYIDSVIFLFFRKRIIRFFGVFRVRIFRIVRVLRVRIFRIVWVIRIRIVRIIRIFRVLRLQRRVIILFWVNRIFFRVGVMLVAVVFRHLVEAFRIIVIAPVGLSYFLC